MRNPVDGRRCFKHRNQGFTLLEIIMAVFVMSALIGGIFAVVSGTVQLTSEMAQMQQEDARAHGLQRLCERVFTGLPAHGQVRLRTKQLGSRYLGQLALRHAPQIFGMERRTGRGLTLLETEEMPGGYLRLVMRWFTEEQAGTWEQGKSEEGQSRLVLMENINVLEWRFYNSESQQWEPVWNEKQKFETTTSADGSTRLVTQGGWRRPGLVELKITTSAGDKIRHVFWVPSVVRGG